MKRLLARAAKKSGILAVRVVVVHGVGLLDHDGRHLLQGREIVTGGEGKAENDGAFQIIFNVSWKLAFLDMAFSYLSCSRMLTVT